MGAEGRAGATVPAGVLEGVRSSYRAFNRGDMAAAVATLAPDIECRPSGICRDGA